MSSATANSKARILIVDDEQAQMMALCDTLRDNGYETFGFETPSAALNLLRESRFDLLLTDLTMPEMDGIALVGEARAIDPDLVAVIMTGAGTIATAVEAMKAGAFDYILKPFKLSVVLPVLARALAQRRLRLENAELQRRIQERTVALEVANRELQAANKDLEAFSYSVSHDLRTPLGLVISFAELLDHTHGAEMSLEARELTGYILKHGLHMNQLITDLLRLAKLGRQPLSVQPVQVATLVREILLELRTHYSGRRIELQVGELPDCRGDRPLLRQVFTNLLSNAFKYTARQPQAVIEVGSRRENGEDIYFIRDNGAGFDMQHAQKLFGVFQRLHQAEEFEGTGVGLSIVQRILQRHGGRIWAESQVGKGATFYFTVAPAPAAAPTPAVAHAQ